MKMAKKTMAMLLCIVMLIGLLPVSAMAATYDYAHNQSASSDGYYNVISKQDWDIAPGIKETEIVLNNADGDYRQVVHLMEADMSNPYTRVISSYTNMDTSNYAISVIPDHAAYIENVWGENVVGIMNTCLSWYNTPAYIADPSRVNEPLGFMMVDGEVFFDHSVGFPTCVVIHKDVNDLGEPRPAEIPKVEMRTVTDTSSLNGWEDQVIPVSSGFIVKDGVNQQTSAHKTDPAARSVVGIKADGSIVIMMNDGRQSPFSAGMNMYEGFIGEEGKADIDTLCDHIFHFMELDPEGRHIALGGDLDGCDPLVAGFDGILGYPKVAQRLLERGLSEEIIWNIFWKNAIGVI